MSRLDKHGYAPHLDVRDWLKNELALGYAAAIGLPMDLIDRRPWVQTHDEIHDPILWGDGTGGCGHADCGDTAGRNLTGLLGAPGVVERPHDWPTVLAAPCAGPACRGECLNVEVRS